jgi:hypothetical protein
MYGLFLLFHSFSMVKPATALPPFSVEPRMSIEPRKKGGIATAGLKGRGGKEEPVLFWTIFFFHGYITHYLRALRGIREYTPSQTAHLYGSAEEEKRQMTGQLQTFHLQTFLLDCAKALGFPGMSDTSATVT